jgi:hypothetical protein
MKGKKVWFHFTQYLIQHTMNINRGVEVQFHAFLTSTINESGQHQNLAALLLGKEVTGTNQM